MASRTGMFSEFWHRVADLEMSLRPGVNVHRQFFRGEKWYILNDPFSNDFFRVRPPAYEFVVRLGKGRTVEQVWEDCLDKFPDTAPGQEEVIQLLAQLSHANLLHSSASPDAQALFNRYKERRGQEMKGRLMSFMFPKFPLLDPDQFLVKTLPLVRPFFSWFGWLIWFVVLGFGLKAVLDNVDYFMDEGQAVLSAGNIPWLYLALILVKALHEFGHAYLCRHYGGEVHRMGIMLLVFTPIPYVDASSSWAIRKRGHRVQVAAGGMIIELFIASLAALLWAITAPGVIHSVCYNMILIASVSTVLFNANPLLRFDGYYILSDLLDIPNLHERARRQLKYVWERYVFGVESATSFAESAREAFWLVTFAILSGLYRMVISVAIIMFVADNLLIVGLLMGVLLLIAWTVVPLYKAVVYLASSPAIARQRMRAVSISLGITVVVVLACFIVPAPSFFKADGVVYAQEYSATYARTDGFLTDIKTMSGSSVESGQPLVTLVNPALDLEINAAAARLKEAEAYLSEALANRSEDLSPMEHTVESVRQRFAYLLVQRHLLQINAGQSGRWAGMDPRKDLGRWVRRGEELGLTVAPDAYEFQSVIPQSEASRLFNDQIKFAQIKIRGQSDITLAVDTLKVIPMDQRRLPSEALALQGGGDVATSENMEAREPFFQVTAVIAPGSDVTFVHGMTGVIRFRLEDEPILRGAFRRALQVLQSRYKF